MSYSLHSEELSDAYAIYKTGPFTVSAGLLRELFTNDSHRGRFYPTRVSVYYDNVPSGASCTLNIGYTTTAGSSPNVGYNDWVYNQTIGNIGTPAYATYYVQSPITMVGDTAMAGVPNQRKSLRENQKCYVKIGTITGSPITITVAVEGFHVGIYDAVSGSIFIETISIGSTNTVYRNIYNDGPPDIIQNRLL